MDPKDAIKIPMPEIGGYVIYNVKTGLFSRGGLVYKRGFWSSRPKIWRTLGHLKNHLNLVLGAYDFGYGQVDRVKRYHINGIYKECLVFDVKTNQPVDFSIYDWYESSDAVKRAKEHGYVIKYVD